MTEHKLSRASFSHAIELQYEDYAIFLANHFKKILSVSERAFHDVAGKDVFRLDNKPVEFVQDFSIRAHGYFTSVAQVQPLPKLHISEGCGVAHVYNFDNKAQTHIFVNYFENNEKIVIVISDMPITPYFPYNYTTGALAPYTAARDNLMTASRFMNWFHHNRDNCARMTGLDLPVKNNYLKVPSMKNLIGIGNDYLAFAHEEYLVFRNLYISSSAENLKKGWPNVDAVVSLHTFGGIKVFSICSTNHYSDAAFNTTFVGDIQVDFHAVNRDIAFQNPGFFTNNGKI